MNTPTPSPKLTHDQMHTVLTDWHAHCVDDPLYAHLEPNFEDMAGLLWDAMKALKAAQQEADWNEQQGISDRDDSWMGRQDTAVANAWLGRHDMRLAA